MPTNTEALTYDDYVKGIQTLKPEEQLSLIEILSSKLKKTILEKKKSTVFLSLKALELRSRRAIDAQEYVRKEREAWG